MFTDKDKNFIEVGLSTTTFLGPQHVGDRFINTLCRYDHSYLPERWDTEDRTRLRQRFDCSSLRAFFEEWTRPEEWKTLFFERTRPFRIEMLVDIQRSSYAKFNEFSAFIHEKQFRNSTHERELLTFTSEIGESIHVDYGYIAHAKQAKRQSAVLTPAERLPGIYWANFFGRPYIEFFGREKLLNTPCYEVREINNDLILLLTAESLNGPEMVNHDEVVNQVKAYLNQNAFAGPSFPDEPCAVPEFNFADVRWSAEATVEETSDKKVARLRTDLQAKGYKLIEEKDGRLIFRGDDKSIVIVDRDRAEVSVDLTGQFLESDGP
jgi:hypothetical protein